MTATKRRIVIIFFVNYNFVYVFISFHLHTHRDKLYFYIFISIDRKQRGTKRKGNKETTMQDRLRRRVSKSLRRRMHTRDDMQTSYQEGLQNDTQGDLLLSRLF